MTRESALEDLSQKENVLTGLNAVHCASGATHHLETTPETTLETVSARISMSRNEIHVSSTPRQQTPSYRRRLPRFTRAKPTHRPRIALQDRDLELLRTVFDYRLITTPQVLCLFEEESRDGIYRRLQKLFHHGYLDRMGTNPNAPLLYGLGPRGSEVLGVSRRKDVADPYVDHQLMIGNFRVAMTRAASERGITLSWRPFPADAPVRPDGFFSLQFPDRPEGKNRAFFFLEADRSTMTRERFVQKLVSYWRWYRAGGHTEKLGIKGFRVLTVTKSEERLRSLLGAIARTSEMSDALAIFWFASEHRFGPESPSRIVEPIWTVAGHSEGLRGLLPIA